MGKNHVSTKTKDIIRIRLITIIGVITIRITKYLIIQNKIDIINIECKIKFILNKNLVYLLLHYITLLTRLSKAQLISDKASQYNNKYNNK